MAAQVLEMNGGGFDLDDVEAVDLDAPAKEGVKVAIAESESDDEKPQTAASHTYDKGYKRWEDFDVDAAADAVDVDSFQKVATYTGSKTRLRLQDRSRRRLLQRRSPRYQHPRCHNKRRSLP